MPDIDDPNLANDLTDMELPKCRKSSTDAAEPHLEKLRNDKELPK
jgi:hypothetical protein